MVKVSRMNFKAVTANRYFVPLSVDSNRLYELSFLQHPTNIAFRSLVVVFQQA